jgi:tyrosyl-tRNA synthetase
MDIDEKLDIISKNTSEIVTIDELKSVLENITDPVTYCGYEPSGPLHLGHFITVTKLIDLEKAGCKVKILLADLHALLNLKGNEDYIAKQVDTWKKTMKLLGLKNPEFVVGSSFQLDGEYWKDIMRMATQTTMKRGLRSMQEVARDIENAKISQIIYPLMQTLDIKFLGINVAQAGLEQRKIHMLAREQLPTIDWMAPVCVHTPLLTSLLGSGDKMSSSIEGSNISVIDNDKEIAKKIKKAYCPEGVLVSNPILEISKLIVFPRIKTLEINRKPKFGGNISFSSYNELEKTFVKKEIHPLDLKTAVSMELSRLIDPIRAEFEAINK